MSETARPYTLECKHKVYYKVAPFLGDLVYCRECNADRVVGPAEATHSRTYQDDFWSEPTGKRKNEYRGGCTAEGCEFTTTARGWFVLENVMHSHYMNVHTNHGSNLELLLANVKGQITDEPPF